jgi:hypothetical protein
MIKGYGRKCRLVDDAEKAAKRKVEVPKIPGIAGGKAIMPDLNEISSGASLA